MTSKTPISVWFFTGALVAFYGVVTLIYGISVLGQPLPNRALAYLHPDIWWGAVMLAVGAFYSIRFYPRNTEKK
jgi:uncharacterized membrane protein HdeD (DUF308 family)